MVRTTPALLLPVALLLAAAAVAQEDGSPSHDEFGFPVTFNDEIITRSDVRRSIGLAAGDVPDVTWRNQRDILIGRKMTVRIADKLGVEVEEWEVDNFVQKEIETAGGEAKWYEELAQRGRTLQQERLDLAHRILQQKLAFVFQHGFTPDGKRLLPWRLAPTPREVAIAYENDAARRSAGARVRRLEMTVDLTRRERGRLMMETNGELDGAQLEAKARELLAPRVEEILAAVEKTSFEEVARERGVDVDAQKEEWVPLPRQSSPNEAVAFLQEAEQGQRSEPLPMAGGGYRILYLVERQHPGSRPASDPDVTQEYEWRIRALRAQKWEAALRLEVLDEATVEPERVREELRSDLVAQLRDAESRLRALGLH